MNRLKMLEFNVYEYVLLFCLVLFVVFLAGLLFLDVSVLESLLNLRRR